MCPTPLLQKCFMGIKDTQVMAYLVVEMTWGLEEECSDGAKRGSSLSRMSSVGFVLSVASGTEWGMQSLEHKASLSGAQTGCTPAAKSLGSLSGLVYQIERS